MKQLLTALTVLVLLTGLVNAQNKAELKSANQVATLITGIQSDNEGLQRSSLFMAGKYKIKESVDAVIKAYDDTDSKSVKFLALRVLLELNSPDAMKKVAEISRTEADNDLKVLADSFYSYLVEHSVRYASN